MTESVIPQIDEARAFAAEYVKNNGADSRRVEDLVIKIFVELEDVFAQNVLNQLRQTENSSADKYFAEQYPEIQKIVAKFRTGLNQLAA